MRIVMIGQKGIPAGTGGIEHHVEMTSRLLAERGHQVVVYCRRSYRAADTAKGLPARIKRVFRPSIPTKHLDAITHTATCTLDVIVRRADVVHYHAIGPAAAAPLARLVGLRTVVTVHGLDWQRRKWGALAKQALRLGERIGAKTAHQVIVVSPHLAQWFQQTHGVTPTVIPNGVEPLPPQPAERIRALGLVPDRFVLCVARLVPEKGLHHIIEAMADDLETPLVIAGDGGLDTAYEARLRARAGGQVHFIGAADRELLGALYTHARLFVLPSEVEGMSLALLEAMAAGLPVLVSDIAENRSVVGESGFTFRVGDVSDLRDKLNELLGDTRRLAAGAEQAAAQARLYRWPAVVDQLETVYRMVAS